MTADALAPALIVQRHIEATPAKVFAAWTDPDRVVQWWGPAEVRCTHADIDLVVDGHFRLANQMPDGSTVWIRGQYKVIDWPNRLEHTWIVEANGVASLTEYVAIDFDASGLGTTITVTHTRIASQEARDGHEYGWQGCLDGFVALDWAER